MSTYVEIEGLTLDDLIGRINIQPNVKHEYNDDSEYTKLPIYFEGKQDWPKHTILNADIVHWTYMGYHCLFPDL